MSQHSTSGEIRDWLSANGPASCVAYSRANGLTGDRAERIGQIMARMFRDGMLSRTGKGGLADPFVYAIARDVLSRADAARVAREARSPPTRKPKPASPRKRTMEHGVMLAAVKADAVMPVVDKVALPDSDAFIAANPDRYERLPMGATSRPLEKIALNERERRMLNGNSLKRVVG